MLMIFAGKAQIFAGKAKAAQIFAGKANIATTGFAREDFGL